MSRGVRRKGKGEGEEWPGWISETFFALHVHVALSSCAALGCFTRRLSSVVFVCRNFTASQREKD